MPQTPGNYMEFNEKRTSAPESGSEIPDIVSSHDLRIEVESQSHDSNPDPPVLPECEHGSILNIWNLSQSWRFTSLDLRMAYQATVLLWSIGHIHQQWPIWPRHHLMDHLWPFVFWGLHGPSPQSRSHSGNLCPIRYFWSFPSKPGEMAEMAVFGHLIS
ncbi:hypothetical protein O181_051794 [Austropuccinia psidii MF-1]|uniref:Uncharacterized protein n=1 Tax=Austropuccinia psidii MF-1 TaxID=1389203 RepID=A0A9Q3HR20_9BASI|nr:hypothetical protein [Austropuccinia psidii MF-1]